MATQEELYATTDGAVWAKEFCDVAKRNGADLDEGWVIGWFANAIETGRTHGQKFGFEKCRGLAALVARNPHGNEEIAKGIENLIGFGPPEADEAS